MNFILIQYQGEFGNPIVVFSCAAAEVQLIASIIEFCVWLLKAFMFLCALQITMFEEIQMQAANLPPV